MAYIQCDRARPCHCEHVGESIGSSRLLFEGLENVSSEWRKVVFHRSLSFVISKSGFGVGRLKSAFGGKESPILCLGLVRNQQLIIAFKI